MNVSANTLESPKRASVIDVSVLARETKHDKVPIAMGMKRQAG